MTEQNRMKVQRASGDGSNGDNQMLAQIKNDHSDVVPSFVRAPTAKEMETIIKPKLEQAFLMLFQTIETDVQALAQQFETPTARINAVDLAVQLSNFKIALTTATLSRDLVLRCVPQLDWNNKLSDMIKMLTDSGDEPIKWADSVIKILQYLIKVYRTNWKNLMVWTWDVASDTTVGKIPLVGRVVTKLPAVGNALGNVHPLKLLRFFVRGFARELKKKFAIIVNSVIFRETFISLEQVLAMAYEFKKVYPQIKDKIKTAEVNITDTSKGMSIAETNEVLRTAFQEWRQSLARLARLKLCVAQQKVNAHEMEHDDAEEKDAAQEPAQKCVTEDDLKVAQKAVRENFEKYLLAGLQFDAANDAAIARTDIAAANALALQPAYMMMRKIIKVTMQAIGLITKGTMIATTLAYELVFAAADQREIANLEAMVKYLETNDPTVLQGITAELDPHQAARPKGLKGKAAGTVRKIMRGAKKLLGGK